MKPYHEDNHVQNFNTHCLDGMGDMKPGSVQCVVTSPPYWGLREYTGEQDIVWGENHCHHEWISAGASDTRVDAFKNWGNNGKVDAHHIKVAHGSACSSCGAWKGAYGLEPTAEMYVQHTVEILRGIRRVLRKDGVVFWNIGDGYAAAPKGNLNGQDKSGLTSTRTQENAPTGIRKKASGVRPKNLYLVPFRVAIAAQEDGWWVRSVIIWSKHNPMPQSMKDRPTQSHEYILMLTKSARYYWDAEAVREKQSVNAHPRGTEAGGRATAPGPKSSTRGDDGISSWLQTEAAQWTKDGQRNLRTVWEFPTQPYPEPHFAVFPEALPERCIKAATSEKGNCSKCGRPWVRSIERVSNYTQREPAHAPFSASTKVDSSGWKPPTITQQGWKAQCSCDAPTEPAVVLDPFCGSGTTLWVAKKLGRRAIGFDISEEYCELALDRNRQAAMQLG